MMPTLFIEFPRYLGSPNFVYYTNLLSQQPQSPPALPSSSLFLRNSSFAYHIMWAVRFETASRYSSFRELSCRSTERFIYRCPTNTGVSTKHDEVTKIFTAKQDSHPNIQRRQNQGVLLCNDLHHRLSRKLSVVTKSCHLGRSGGIDIVS